jgi:plasmid stabilization system protein ParE
MSGFVFHPSAISDLEEIWEFIAEDSADAADRLMEEIRQSIRGLVPFQNRATCVAI